MKGMPKAHVVNELIGQIEYHLAQLKAVQAVFPDAKVYRNSIFTSKTVNQNYTKFSFEKRWSGLYVSPYCEVPFTYGDKTEILKVHSQPRYNRLVYLSWRKKVDGKRVMKFARVAINMKNNAIREDMLNACRAEIMGFIKNNPGYHMDAKHLEPRLKKLLVFT